MAPNEVLVQAPITWRDLSQLYKTACIGHCSSGITWLVVVAAWGIFSSFLTLSVENWPPLSSSFPECFRLKCDMIKCPSKDDLAFIYLSRLIFHRNEKRLLLDSTWQVLKPCCVVKISSWWWGLLFRDFDFQLKLNGCFIDVRVSWCRKKWSWSFWITSHEALSNTYCLFLVKVCLQF